MAPWRWATRVISLISDSVKTEVRCEVRGMGVNRESPNGQASLQAH
jgi:hypothetical protein